MTLSKSQKRDMLKAKDLIKKKQYSDAYQLIEDIDHSVAQNWREKLLTYLDEEFDDPFDEESDNSSAKNLTKSNGRRRKWIYAIGIITLATSIIAIVILTLLIPRVNEVYDDIVEEKDLQELYLKFYDSPVSDINSTGEQWQYTAGRNGYSLTTSTIAFSVAEEGASTRTFEEQTSLMSIFTVNCVAGDYIVGVKAVSDLKTNDDNLVYASLVFDDDPQQNIVMNGTIRGSGVFFSDMNSELFMELIQSSILLIELQTLNGLNQHAKFDISGFQNASKDLERECGALPN